MTDNQNKGVFLQEFYGIKDIPALTLEDGSPTKFAEAAKFWGEEIPKTVNDVKQLVAKGAALIATNNLTEPQKFSQSSYYGGKQDLSVLRNNQIKVPFVKTGQWKHDAYGEVKFTKNDIDQLVNNFKTGVTGFTPYLTLGHLDEEPESTDSHRKRGDLEDIVVEGETAYGIFSVGEDIYNSIQKGEYEYSSGEFNRRFTDKESGANVGTAVIRVALTNSPFLPFGDAKVQALSDTGESCPETNENCVFLLSIDTSNSSNVSEPVGEAATETPEEAPKQELSETVVEDPTPTQDINNTTLPNKESIMPNENLQTAPVANEPAAVTKTEEVDATKLESTKVEPTAEPAKAEPVAIKEEDATASKTTKVEGGSDPMILSQLQKIQELYQSQLEAANKTIADLASKVAALTDKLNGQEEVTQAFSTSMSQAQEQSMIQSLQSNGIQPATVQKFLAFKNAFEAADNKNIVKFSQTVGEETKEVEYNVVDTVANLLVATANQTPLVEQQLGVSAGRKSGAFDFSNIIAKNAEAATKIK